MSTSSRFAFIPNASPITQQPHSRRRIVSTNRRHIIGLTRTRACIQPSDAPQFPPSTTSLVLQIGDTDTRSIGAFIGDWLGEFIFSSQGALPVPVSLDFDTRRSLVYFYAADGAARGRLAFGVEASDAGDVVLRVTSASRFVNARGKYSATLPGERRIIRALFSAIGARFDEVSTVYKPAYIRLRRDAAQRGVPVTVLVGEVGGVCVATVRRFVAQWAARVQFGARLTVGFWDSVPDIATEMVEDGVRIRVYARSGVQMVAVQVRERAVGQGRLNKVLVLVSATHARGKGTRVIVNRLSRDLVEGLDCRIHSSS